MIIYYVLCFPFFYKKDFNFFVKWDINSSMVVYTLGLCLSKR
jgi:hypothetical protein